MLITKPLLKPALGLLLLFFPLQISLAQDTVPEQGITHSGQRTGQPAFPVESYTELPNPTATPVDLWKEHNRSVLGWGNTYTRYKKEQPVAEDSLTEHLQLKAWKGEKLSAQWLVSAGKKELELSVVVSDLKQKGSGELIPKENIQSAFVRYVLTDELNKDGQGACGHRLAKDFDSTLVADVIDDRASLLKIAKHTTRPGWISIKVPESAAAGIYSGKIEIRDGSKTLKSLPLSVEVGERELPAPQDWEFHLDLWQNPYAAARYYKTELWSEAHFEFMARDYRQYAQAGGKSITASIIDRPWNGQTHDPFHSMVRWTKQLDGSWAFNFDVFDRWVEFMMGLGVTKQINAYSMIPWKLSFAYFDEASNTTRHLQTQPGEAEYEEAWIAMLRQFAAHLKQKGWFDKTYIAMDERSMEAMRETIKVIRKADPGFRISFAGSLHPELFEDIDDYCVSLGESFPEEVKSERRQQGKISTFYTSCAHAFPNSFTFSPPAETEWYGWYAANQGLDGYLRWAYNSWVLEPLLDSRFTTWAAGDTYFVYPGGRSSLRFEKLVEGIQAYEKIRLLKEEFREEGNPEALQKLETALALFSKEVLEHRPASEVIEEAKGILNTF